MWNKAKLLVFTLLSIIKLPVADNKVAFSDDQKKTILDALGEDGPAFIEEFVKMGNKELANATQLTAAEKEIADAKTQLKALLAENGVTMLGDEEESEETSAEVEASHQMASLIANLQGKITGLETKIKKLGAESEEDVTAILNNNPQMKIAHSKTHLFGSGKSYDAFEGRPWNQRLAGIKTSSSEWTDTDISKVKEDLGDFFRLDRPEIIKILKDYRGLPAHWPVINNVDDKISYLSMITGEITQARKKAWLPKNKNKFAVIEGQIFPVQIDMEWTGFELQKIETTAMNRFNQEGSQPYKNSFVAMMVMAIMEKARDEDKNVLINGIHVPTADDETVPQSFMFRGNGLLKIISTFFNVLYKPFAMGKPTIANITDYTKQFGERLPVEINTAPLDLYMSRIWVRRLLARKKIEDGVNTDYTGATLTIDGFPNINIEPLDYLDGTDFMFMTTRDNIAILQNIKEEGSFLNMDTFKRDIFIYGDYKLGIHVGAFGVQWEDGVPLDYRNQIFFSNDVEIFPENVYAPIAANDSTPSAKYHTVLQTGLNTGATAITDIDDTKVGDRIVIRGNGTTNASTIANAGAFNLDGGAITLSENVEIVLEKIAAAGDGRFIEYKRSTLNAENEEYFVLDPGATTANAANGTMFLTSANAGATALTDIANAIEDETYIIRGGSDTNATTIAQSGKFSRITAAITLEDGNEIVVKYNGSKFVELSRVVA